LRSSSFGSGARTVEELRAAVREFARLYNAEWPLERHGYRTLAEARELMLAVAVA
jgi:hypothetical protein